MAIKIEVYTKDIVDTERIKDFVTKKTTKLERYLSDISDARIDLSNIKTARNSMDRQIAQITIRRQGTILRTEERNNDIFAAFDAALLKMQRKIERYKGKHKRGRGDGRSLSEEADRVFETRQSKRTSLIVRRKIFEMTPMNESEALEQMKLLGHDNFFVFFNAETSKINVLYRRHDGKYGLIEPTMV